MAESLKLLGDLYIGIGKGRDSQGIPQTAHLGVGSSHFPEKGNRIRLCVLMVSEEKFPILLKLTGTWNEENRVQG